MSRSRSCFGRKKFQGRMKVRIGQLETAWGRLDLRLGGDEIRTLRSFQ